MPDPSVLYPNALYGTQGVGVWQEPDVDTGEFEGVPYRRTPPFGEPDPYPAPEALDPGEISPADPPINTALEDDLLHEQMHGSHHRGYYIDRWQNPSNPGVPNLGPVNDQPFVSGHSQIGIPNPSAEQGWGLDPAILLSRFPHSENVFPGYSAGRFRRNGSLEFTSAGIPFGTLTAQTVQLQTVMAGRQRSSVHVRLADNPQGVPFSSTVVPVGGSAGPIPYHVPVAEDDGIY